MEPGDLDAPVPGTPYARRAHGFRSRSAGRARARLQHARSAGVPLPVPVSLGAPPRMSPRLAPRSIPALVVHGGAGARGPSAERPRRRRGMMAAARRGVELLRAGADALAAVVAAVEALENDEYFNAGYGSVLNLDGKVEMDAALMVAEPPAGGAGGSPRIRAGAVAAVSRVRNPILLARAVMENTPHLLMAGAGAERFAAR